MMILSFMKLGPELTYTLCLKTQLTKFKKIKIVKFQRKLHARLSTLFGQYQLSLKQQTNKQTNKTKNKTNKQTKQKQTETKMYPEQH